MLTLPVFLIIFGLLLLITPGFLIQKHGDDPEEAIQQWLSNSSLDTIFLIQAISLSGRCFLFMGAALLIIG